MSSTSDKNPENVARGLKAAINNPNVSEEAKANAAERLEGMGEGGEVDHGTNHKQSSGGLSAGSALGTRSQGRGGPGSVQNDPVSADYEYETDGVNRTQGDTGANYSQEGDLSNRQLGGYKATLNNPNVSDAAKQHAEEVLEENNAL